MEKISIYSSWKFQELKAEVRRRGLVTRGYKRSISIAQLEADDLERANEASVRSLDLNPVESEVSPEVLEQRRTVDSGLPWPHIHYDSPLDISDGINYVRAASTWRCIAPFRIIEWRLSRDCCLHDFPEHFPLKPISEYRRCSN